MLRVGHIHDNSIPGIGTREYDFLYLVLDLPGRVPLYIKGQAEVLLATLARQPFRYLIGCKA